MASRETVLAKFQKVYDDERAQECQKLHDAFGRIMKEENASIQNTLFVIEMIRFELLRAKYEQLMGNVKLGSGPPVSTGSKL